MLQKKHLSLVILGLIVSCSKTTDISEEEYTLDPEQEGKSSSIILNLSTTRIESNVTSRNIQETFYFANTSFVYEANGEFFYFTEGAVDEFSRNLTERSQHPPLPSQVLKRQDGKWIFHHTEYDAKFWGARNFKIIGNKVALGDGNEIGQQGPVTKNDPDLSDNWRGDTLLGEFNSDGTFNWTVVNDSSNQMWFHGTTMGDLNGDGLLDIGGAPNYIGNDLVSIFIQNEEKKFLLKDDFVEKTDESNPFTLEFHDLDGDGLDEIITADYGAPDPSLNNNIRVFKFSSETGTFLNVFKSNSPTAFYPVGLGATSIKCADFDNDGLLDISVAREDVEYGNAFEIWKGIGDNKFTPFFSSPVWDFDSLQFREFIVLDVNKDGYKDIILRPFHYGSLYRNNPVWWDVPSNNGVKLNTLIQINDGTGRFNSYDKEELIVEAVNVDTLHPYLDNGTLHFMGTWMRDYKNEPYMLQTVDIGVTLK